MKDIKDYRVSVKVRNNRILRAAEGVGLSIPALAKAIGASYPALNDLVNMTTSPFGRNGDVYPWVERLILFTGVPFDELFSEQQREALVSNRSEREVDADEMFAFISASDRPQMSGPDYLAETAELSRDVAAVFESALSKRQQYIIDRRYGLHGQDEMTYSDIATELGVTTERVRQLEFNALRKLKHPCASASLIRHLNSFGGD